MQYAIDAERSSFAYQMQQLLLRSQRLIQYRDALPAELFQQQVDAIEQACDALLGIEVRTPIARRLQKLRGTKQSHKHREHLFVFLYDHQVPFDNNGSERALRNSVVHRKVLAGFRSKWGASAFAVARSCEELRGVARYEAKQSKAITTVIETARKGGARIFEALRALLGPPMPDAYANRSP